MLLTRHSAGSETYRCTMLWPDKHCLGIHCSQSQQIPARPLAERTYIRNILRDVWPRFIDEGQQSLFHNIKAINTGSAVKFSPWSLSFGHILFPFFKAGNEQINQSKIT